MLQKPVPSSVTVNVDSRERVPPRFPETTWVHPRQSGTPFLVRVAVRRIRMATGDYSLADFEDVMLIEKKGTSDELWQNFMSPDRERALAALDRLSIACSRPVLWLDGTLRKFTNPPYIHGANSPWKGIDLLLQETEKRGIQVLLLDQNKGTNRDVGEFLLHMMLTAALLEDT